MMAHVFQERYYRLNKFLLSLIGQWPYQTLKTRITLILVVVLLATSTVIPQIIGVMHNDGDMDVVIESLSPFVADIACSNKLANMIFNAKKFLKLSDRMKLDWADLRDQPEIEVLHDYAEKSRKYSLAYAVVSYTIAVVFLAQPVVPQLLVALNLIPVRPKKFPYPVDYFGIDFDTYYYYMFVHGSIAVSSIVTVSVAADTMFIAYVQHACACFIVVGRQFDRMIRDLPDTYDVHCQAADDPAFRNLTACIKKHKEAIEFAQVLEDTYTWLFFSFLGLNMIMLSATGYQMMGSLDTNAEDAFRYVGFIIAELGHLFVQSYFSQMVEDCSQRVRDDLFQAEWYKTSLRTQKLITLVTMRTALPCQLTAGKIMVMSVENFTAVVKTSMSYFTFLRSSQ